MSHGVKNKNLFHITVHYNTFLGISLGPVHTEGRFTSLDVNSSIDTTRTRLFAVSLSQSQSLSVKGLNFELACLYYNGFLSAKWVNYDRGNEIKLLHAQLYPRRGWGGRWMVGLW